jgi:hypothetical protein
MFSTAVQTLVCVCWFLADFGNGVSHWSVENHGNGQTSVMSGIVVAFQGYHAAPWTITERNNVYMVTIPFGNYPPVGVCMRCYHHPSPFRHYLFASLWSLVAGIPQVESPDRICITRR